MGGVGSALIGGATGLAQGYLGNKAASAARAANNAGYDTLSRNLSDAKSYLLPYTQAGSTALAPLTGLLTGNQYDPKTGQTTALTNEQRNNLFYQSPGYQYNYDQTMKALERSQNARGLYLSAAGQREVAQTASGLASQNYDNYVSRLSQLALMGQNAATGTASAITGLAGNMAYYQQQGGLANAQKYMYQAGLVGGYGSQLMTINQAGGFNNLFGGGGSSPPANATQQDQGGAYQIANGVKYYG